MTDIATTEYVFPTGDGWLLHAVRTSHATARPTGRPLLVVHGFAMNSFIFGYHPRGTPLTMHFAAAGLEVWTIDLRNAGRSRADTKNPTPPSMEAHARIDLATAVAAVLDRTRTEAERVDVIGCSLGGSIIYAHLALMPEHRLGSVVTIGSPLQWVGIHPRIRRLVGVGADIFGRIGFQGTRRAAQLALPLITRAKGLLNPYMNPKNVLFTGDAARQMTNTIEDPHPRLNADLARWMRNERLLIGNVDVTSSLTTIDRPLLAVLANRDGIVPPATVSCVMDAWGGGEKGVLNVGTPERWYAHADLFVGDEAPTEVFEPVLSWLQARH